LGSSDSDVGRGIAVDANGSVYVTGDSTANWGNPVNPYPYAGLDAAFVAKLSSSGKLMWSTFLGSSDTDVVGIGIAVDASGSVYVTGLSGADWGNPVNPWGGQRADTFVAKLSSSGKLIWSTFLGYDGFGNDIAVDANGSVYVIDCRAFVTKLSSSGKLMWSTFLGSSGTNTGEGIAVDASGSVYVTGYSSADWGNPVNAHTGNGKYDAFVAKLSSSGKLMWNTFLGSSDSDVGEGIAVDASGSVYVTGNSSADWGNPVNPYPGSFNGFVAKLSNSGVLTWSTFLSSIVRANDIAVDAYGRVYVIGNSIHVARLLSSSGVQTGVAFLGSSGTNTGMGIAVGANSNVYVTGYSTANWGSPVNAHTGNGEKDAFVATIKVGGTGDINSDGSINVLDVRLCLQIAVGSSIGTVEQRSAADIDGDGDVDRTDAEILAEYVISVPILR